MSEQKSHNTTPPFLGLGTHLKYLREQLKETLHEASGAVEIDSDVLSRIEMGFERPSEDILLLLIQHYNMQDQEAVQLWELAGYDSEASPHKFRLEEAASAAFNNKQMVMLLAMDVRTMYSDGVDININQAGVTLSFTQTAGNNQRHPVGRIGMSYEQAHQVLKTLEQALLKAKYMNGPQGLPAPKEQTDKNVES
jgi:transcriptional regulator with XRE-family HTH domain